MIVQLDRQPQRSLAVFTVVSSLVVHIRDLLREVLVDLRSKDRNEAIGSEDGVDCHGKVDVVLDCQQGGIAFGGLNVHLG
jgi:hypothetical protein